MPIVERIKYERLFSVGSFEHVKLGVELTLTEGDHFQDVFHEARAICQAEMEKEPKRPPRPSRRQWSTPPALPEAKFAKPDGRAEPNNQK